jgi:Kef-type K+ transport system membrane component KefB/Trk K+ transport system NAD-binding subunit/ABC-type transporter Mla MlaB component
MGGTSSCSSKLILCNQQTTKYKIHMEHLFYELGLVVISAGVVGVISYYLKQPLILAYIIAGILIGPAGFGLIHDVEFIEIIASVGIMLMLFLVGLEMNYERLKDLGVVALVAGIGQVLITGTVGFFIVKAFGFTFIQSIYMAVALTFSSTVIAITLLVQKRDINSFYGQIAIGILIVQDVLAILALLMLAGFQEGSFAFDYVRFAGIIVKGTGVAIATLLLSKYILTHLYNKISKSHELLIVVSLAWAFIIAIISQRVGFSMEIGAFIAGLSLANLPYTFEINAKAKVLRDFFITIFFVGLGAGMVFASITNLIVPFLALSLFVLIGNPIIVLVIMGAMGYDKRTAFFTGLTIANISEFSLIVIALGSKLGHLNQEVISMVTIIAILTMVISSYMMIYNAQLYRLLKGPLSFFEFRKSDKTQEERKVLNNHIILLGAGSMGEQILEQVISFKDDYVVIDHDNQVIKRLHEKKINCIFADMDNEEVLQDLNIENAEIIISTLPNVEDNYFLLQYLDSVDPTKKPIVIATANSGREGFELFLRSVDYIILKPYLGAQHVHGINKELYELEEEFKGVQVISANEMGKAKSELKSDQDYARMLQNLNKLRLKELKHKLETTKLTRRGKKRVKLESKGSRITLHGKLHLSTAGSIEKAIKKVFAEKKHLTLDLKHVCHIDDGTLFFLLDQVRVWKQKHRSIRFSHLKEHAITNDVTKKIFEEKVKMV